MEEARSAPLFKTSMFDSPKGRYGLVLNPYQDNTYDAVSPLCTKEKFHSRDEYPARDDYAVRDDYPVDDDYEDGEDYPEMPASRKSGALHTIAILTLGLVLGFLLGFLMPSASSPSPSSPPSPPVTEQESVIVGGVKQFAPEMPMTSVVFEKKAELMDAPSEANQPYWDAMLPTGFGFVNISNPEDYDLQPGISIESGPDRFGVAMYHQMHCVALLRRQWWELYDDLASSTPESRRVLQQKMAHHGHASHCFAYLTQSILCSADLTMEWANVEEDGSRQEVGGWGVPHQCKDPEAVRDWVEANHGPEVYGGLHLEDT